ncbi:oligosaccharide flippase family protein [Acinetobacter indicus]|uniref:oligosaccharide flippase family protein n=1 Tax=Acinetobacter indicus TaxID=756892 RepID=UPI000CEC842A|nr:oligosaccharide flippase family protein [Acinetobacter indicus]
MLNKLKKHKKLIENFSALSVLQVSQLLLSFLTFPYLIKTLGMENYGVIVYSQSVIMFLTLIINYGFSATATKDIAESNLDEIKIKKIVTSVYWCKLTLLIPVLIFYAYLVYFFEILNKFAVIYYLSSIGLLASFLFPDWFFQGIEKMLSITYVMLISKVIAVVLIFVYIKSPDDLLWVVAINTLTSLCASVISLYLLSGYYRLSNFLNFNFYNIVAQFKKGSAYFFSNIVANSKEIIGVLLIGVSLDYQSVAIYDFCKKILNILLIPTSSLMRAVFPQASVKKSIPFNKKFEKILLIYSFFAIFIVFIIPDNLWEIVFNQEVIMYKNYLYMISLCLPLYILCGSNGFLTLVGFGESKKFARNILLSSIFYIFILTIGVLFEFVTIYFIIYTLIFSLLVEMILHLKSVHVIKSSEKF